ncbi:MAG: hypothetical protein P1V97_00905 [Planctomycetota bacterium]|nr:hypothetical protein [Planctomycetota bacterium]
MNRFRIPFLCLFAFLFMSSYSSVEAWDKELGEFKGKFSTMRMDEKRIYLLVGDYSQYKVHVYERENGKEVWSYSVSGKMTFFHLFGKLLIVGEVVLDPKSGRVVNKIPKPVGGDRYIESDKYFYYQTGYDLYCINSKGRVRWKQSLAPFKSTTVLLNPAKGGVAVYATDGYYFISNKGKIKRLYRLPKKFAKGYSNSYTYLSYKGKRVIVAVANNRTTNDSVVFLVEQGRVKKKLKMKGIRYFAYVWPGQWRRPVLRRGKDDFLPFSIYEKDKIVACVALNLTKREFCPKQKIEIGYTPFHNGMIFANSRLLKDIVTGKTFPKFSNVLGYKHHWTATKNVGAVDKKLYILDPVDGTISLTKFEFPVPWTELTSRSDRAAVRETWNDSELLTIYSKDNAVNEAAVGVVDVTNETVHTMVHHKNVAALSNFAQFGDKKGYAVFYVTKSPAGVQKMQISYKSFP